MKSSGTTVTFLKRSDGALLGYRANGHSGYAEAGADIVCAAISALTQTTLNGLKNVLKAPVMFDQDDDGAFIEAILTPEASEDQIRQARSEEHTSELQSLLIVHLVCRLLLEIGRASCRERV